MSVRNRTRVHCFGGSVTTLARTYKMAVSQGFEPRFLGSEPSVLPNRLTHNGTGVATTSHQLALLHFRLSPGVPQNGTELHLSTPYCLVAGRVLTINLSDIL